VVIAGNKIAVVAEGVAVLAVAALVFTAIVSASLAEGAKKARPEFAGSDHAQVNLLRPAH
jgi:hypothetical protein